MPLKLLLEKTGVVGYITMHPLMVLGEPYMWDALHTLKLLEVLGSFATHKRQGGRERLCESRRTQVVGTRAKQQSGDVRKSKPRRNKLK